MNITKQQVRALRKENATFSKVLDVLPRSKWPTQCLTMQRPPDRVYRSQEFLMQIYYELGYTRLTISRTDWDIDKGRFRDNISWDDIQRLKSEAGFGASWAVEVYPAESEVVNVANMRHIWLLLDAPPYAWRAKHSKP